MITRCTNKKVAAYKRYGGAGVSVCSEWRKSFATFRDWALAAGYSEELEIDRIMVAGNYEPSNCRWATLSQQAANKRCNKGSSRLRGFTRATASTWSAKISCNGKKIHIGCFRTRLEAALAYDDAAIALHGRFAYLNFPERYRSAIGEKR